MDFVIVVLSSRNFRKLYLQIILIRCEPGCSLLVLTIVSIIMTGGGFERHPFLIISLIGLENFTGFRADKVGLGYEFCGEFGFSSVVAHSVPFRFGFHSIPFHSVPGSMVHSIPFHFCKSLYQYF